MYHGENFEKMTQYDELGCIFLHNYAFSFLTYKHKYIVSVEGIVRSFCILNVWGHVPSRNFLKSGTI